MRKCNLPAACLVNICKTLSPANTRPEDVELQAIRELRDKSSNLKEQGRDPLEEARKMASKLAQSTNAAAAAAAAHSPRTPRQTAIRLLDRSSPGEAMRVRVDLILGLVLAIADENMAVFREKGFTLHMASVQGTLMFVVYMCVRIETRHEELA